MGTRPTVTRTRTGGVPQRRGAERQRRRGRRRRRRRRRRSGERPFERGPEAGAPTDQITPVDSHFMQQQTLLEHSGRSDIRADSGRTLHGGDFVSSMPQPSHTFARCRRRRGPG